MSDAMQLPPARPGHQWLVQIFPGGRAVLVQAKPYRLSTADDAVKKLAAGYRVYVAMSDAPQVAYARKQAARR